MIGTALISCVYTGAIIFLVCKLRNIRKNPSKYNKIPGYEEYCKSTWYWPTGRDFGRETPPGRCDIFAGGTVYVLVSLWFIASSPVFILLGARSAGAEHIFIYYNAMWFIYIPLILAFAFSLSYYVPMFSRRPEAICQNIHKTFRGSSRAEAWEKMTIIVLVITSAMFLCRICILNNYGYFDDEKLVYRPPLAFHEKVFVFQDIVSVETFIEEESGRVKRCYVYNPDGEGFDISGNITCLDDSDIEIFSYVSDRLPENLRERLSDKTD